MPMRKDALPYMAGDAGLESAPPIEESYDYVIIATGSRPFVPPMDGFGKAGTFMFRTIDDCSRIADYAQDCKKAVVIGGGLLGLEAARGLLTHGVEVTVLEAAPQLMIAQLDPESGQILKSTMEGMGVKVFTDKITTHIVDVNGKITHLQCKDGCTIETDMVVVSAGIRPITEVASVSGLTVDKAIVCDDQMRTSDPDIFSVGECVQHRGRIYGLVDPIWEMANVLADVITGKNTKAAYLGSKLGTKLKVMGCELASMGETKPQPTDEVVLYREPSRGIYQKIIIRENKLAGAILLGDISSANALLQMFYAGSRVPDRRSEMLFGSEPGGSMVQAVTMPDSVQICNCNGVSKKQIVDAIQSGCTSLAKVGGCTRAGSGCGSCKGMITQLIEAYKGAGEADPSEHFYVPGIALEKSQLVAEIRSRELKSVSAVFRELAVDGKEDAASKVGLASLLEIALAGRVRRRTRRALYQ